MKRLGMALMLCGLFAGCGNLSPVRVAYNAGKSVGGSSGSPRIDATSEDSVNASIQRMTAGLTAEQKHELSEAVTVMIAEPATAISLGAALSEGSIPDDSVAMLFRPVDGLTRDEIIARAAAVRAQAVAASNPSRP